MSSVKYVNRTPMQPPARNAMGPLNGNETHPSAPVVQPRGNLSVVQHGEQAPEGQMSGGDTPMPDDPPPCYASVC